MHVTDDPRVGTELAGYRIESLLGFGGMSVVYVAEDLHLKRRVALKLLATSLAEDGSFRERFLRESELAASIDHPNIVPIYEAGATDDDLLFIAMRYVEGYDLRERFQRGRLDTADAIGIVAQVASALDAAHGRGLVHRDVKPSNVLLDPGARPDGSDHAYLADFGLTKLVSEESSSTDGRSLGTIDYVAPEQIAGADVDGRADVYSLGCVLYECLVGQPPFRSDSDLAVVFAHLETESPLPSEVRPELPSALDGVIARALAKVPEQRYQSCRELAQAALAVAVDEASRVLVDVASRAAAGRSDLGEVEAELSGRVIDLQVVREHARALTGPVTPARVAAEGICPFKGLASFEPVDADYYFGRERLVAELVARLVGAGFLGIVGPSGSGKSSVLRAGLLPALAGGVLPGSGGWRRLLLRPGERPLEELRRALVSGARDPLAEALDTLPPNGRLLLGIDQLEELFTACDSDAERAGFAETIARAASDPDGRAVVVVALRADFYGRFAAYSSLADLLGANHVLVSAMEASELRRAVELPAGRVGLRVEPELTDALVDDVEGEPGALPLLSTALLELWQARDDNTLTLAAYRTSGGVHGAVARLAEGTYARIPDERRPIVRPLMLRLVGEGEAEVPVRRRAPLAELDLERSGDVADVLGTLANSRLVTVSQGTVEVAHEALLHEWPRLREWIDEDSEGRRLRRHITQAATEWDADGRDQGELYRGARLAAALDWSTDHALELNELEREFVAESREVSAQETKRVRRTNRRLRGLLAGVAVLLAAALAGGVFAIVQRGEARDAETAQLAQRLGAQALVEEDLDLSLLLARQAVAIADTAQTRGYLLSALRRSPAAIGVMHGTGAVLRGIALSPDGRTLAVSSGGSGLLFFDTGTYARLGDVLPAKASESGSVVYSPDGRVIALVRDNSVRVVDARTHARLAEADLHGDPSVAFTRDGSRLAVLLSHPGEADAEIIVLDSGTLEPIGRAIEPESFVGAYVGFYYAAPQFALTPDDRFVLTASENGELTQWNLRTGRKTRTWRIETGTAPALALSPDGRTVAIGMRNGVQLIDLRSGATWTATADLAGSPNYVLFSPDGKTVVSTNRDTTVTRWDVGTAALLETLHGHSNFVQQPVFSSDGKTLYTVSHDGTAIAWDLTGDRRLGRPFTFTHDRRFSAGGYDGHPGRFSPDGKLLAVGLKERGIALWDARTLTPIGRPLLDTGGEVKSLDFSPDAQTLAAATAGEGKASVTLWDVQARARLHELDAGYPSVILAVGFSPDGSTFATASSNLGLQLWNPSTGRTLDALGFVPGASDVTFGADGALIATISKGAAAEVLETATRAPIATFESARAGEDSSVALSPDGRLLAVGGIGRVVRIWDIRSGKLVHELDQGGNGAFTLEFSPDARTLYVSGFEPVASLWDVATGAQIGPHLSAGDRRTMIDLSADGRRLLEIHADGKGAVWDVDPESWERRACTVANRTLTREEWNEFLPGRRYEPACTD